MSLVKDVDARAKIEDILDHPFLAENAVDRDSSNDSSSDDV